MSEIDYSQFEKEGKVRDIPDNLPYFSGSYEVNQFLDRLGIEHNPDSIVLEDSFNGVLHGNNNGEYEVWLIHKSVPYLNTTAFKVKPEIVERYY